MIDAFKQEWPHARSKVKYETKQGFEMNYAKDVPQKVSAPVP